MTVQNKPRKKKKTKLTPIRRLVAIGLIALSSYFVFQIGRTVYTTFSLRSQLKDVQSKLDAVQSQNDTLTAEKSKLQDPDYVKSYARNNYNLSKQGEQIFYLPEDSNK